VVTAERHVMLFAMGGRSTGSAGAQENIDDWDFASTTNTAGFYSIEPASRIIDAVTTQYSTIFWTVEGAYAVSVQGAAFRLHLQLSRPAIGAALGPGRGGHSGTVTWAAADGFWRFDGSAVAAGAVPDPRLVPAEL
jgi:hypothetical protein